jgi:hypothetical protein
MSSKRPAAHVGTHAAIRIERHFVPDRERAAAALLVLLRRQAAGDAAQADDPAAAPRGEREG